jgi:hypothetical protein
MLTVVFILENNCSTITECLESLDCLAEYISNYHIQSYYSEDYETLDIIEKWAKNRSIGKLKTLDKSNITLYIYGNEKISQCNIKKIDINQLYNLNVYDFDYYNYQNRINGFLENTDNNIDIDIEKIQEDPVEIQRRAINILIKQLDTKPDYAHIAHLFRVGGNLSKAEETILKEKDENAKTPKYYNELILASNKKYEYIMDFYRKYNSILEASYYYLEYLYKNKLYSQLYTVLYDGYKNYGNKLITNTQNEYNKLAYEILKYCNNDNLSKVDIFIQGHKLYENVVKLGDRLLVINEKNLLDSQIYDFDNSKMTVIGNLGDLEDLHNISGSFNYIKNVDSISPVVYFNNKINTITGTTERLFCNYLKDPELLKFTVNNDLIHIIDKIYTFKNNLIFLDTIPDYPSIHHFISNFPKELNPIYIGLSQNIFNSDLNKLIGDYRHLTVSNCNKTFIDNTELLFKEIGLNIDSYYIIKYPKEQVSLSRTGTQPATYQSRDNDYSENRNGVLKLVKETGNTQETKVDCFVINLESREDRISRLRNEYSNIFNLKRISALEHKVGWVGCFQSHQRCLRIAKKANLKTVLVLEDDCCLFNKETFLDQWKTTKDWLDNNLDKWEIFLGGCTNLKEDNVIGYENKTLGLVRLNFATTAHFIYYNSSIFDKIIDFNIDFKSKYTPVDLVLCEFAKDKILTKIPFLAKQYSDFSNIENRLVNYDIMFQTSLDIINKKLSKSNLNQEEQTTNTKNTSMDLEYINSDLIQASKKEKIIDTNLISIDKNKENDNVTKKIISPILMGGLGNRMFQIASAYAIAKKQNKELEVINVLPNKHSNINYFENIFSLVKHTRINNDLKYITTNIYKEPDNKALKYMEIPNLNENMKLLGYFQSEKYFVDSRDEILNLFRMSEEKKHELITKYPKVSENYFVHFRRGDYLEIFIHNIDNMDYYKKSLEFLENKEKDIKYLVFSDDINYCKSVELLKNRNVEFIEDLNELDSLYLMSLCKGGIGVNSTYSWWGGWLIENSNKTVIYPSRWFNNTWEMDLGWKGCWIYDFNINEIILNVPNSHINL